MLEESVTAQSVVSTLPSSVLILPDAQIRALVEQPDLVTGLIASSSAYADASRGIETSLTQSRLEYEQGKQLMADYDALSSHIQEQIRTVEEQYRTFLALQTEQHQLLLTLSPEFALRNKFKQMVETRDRESRDLLKTLQFPVSDDNVTANDLQWLESFARFRESRHVFHLVQEKMYRWDEERVSGMTS